MRKLTQAVAATISMACMAQAAGGAALRAATSRSTVASEPSGAGVLATVRVEFRAADEVRISIAPGLEDAAAAAEQETAVAVWPAAEGRLWVSYDAAADRLEARIENGADSAALVANGIVQRGFGRLDPLRFAPRVMGLLAETANRGDAGSIELREAEVGAGRRARPLQEIGAGARSVSQLLHAGSALAPGFSLAGTIRLSGARPSAAAPMSVEIRLLADRAEGDEPAAPPAAPDISSATFTNATPTTILPLGAASPYPSQIVIDPGSYLTGVLTSVVVGWDNLDHTYPGEIGALLVDPAGHSVELMRRACGDFDLVNTDLVFDDAAVLTMPNAAPCFSGSWKPTGWGPTDNYPPPAPAGTPGYSHSFATLLGDSPIGTWSLYLYTHVDYGLIDLGVIDAWSLTLTTRILIPATGTFGVAAPYPSTYSFSGIDPTLGLRNCTVTISGLTHSYVADLHLLFAAPSGQAAYLVGDACAGTSAVDLDWTFDDAAAGFLQGPACASGAYRPTVLGVRTFPAPAPTGPHGPALAEISGSGSNGVFALYALDDASGDSGTIRDWGFSCSAQAYWLFSDGFETGDLLRWSATAP